MPFSAHWAAFVSALFAAAVFLYLFAVQAVRSFFLIFMGWLFLVFSYFMDMVHTPSLYPFLFQRLSAAALLWSSALMIAGSWTAAGKLVPSWARIFLAAAAAVPSVLLFRQASGVPFLALSRIIAGMLSLANGVLCFRLAAFSAFGRYLFSASCSAFGLGQLLIAYPRIGAGLLGSLPAFVDAVVPAAAIGGIIMYIESMVRSIRRSELHYENLLRLAPTPILVLDESCRRILDANASAERFFGHSRGELASVPLDSLVLPEDASGTAAEDGLRNAAELRSGEPIRIEQRVRGRDGKPHVCDVHMVLLSAASPPIVRASYSDITDRIDAEDRLRQALEEKEVLLRELFHRTKNNMNVINSLLMLHSVGAGGEGARDAFRNVMGEIYAMSLVHDKLYEAQDLSRIDLRKYVLDLVCHIRSTYCGDAPCGEFEFELEEVRLPVDGAIPFGLLFNELCTGVMKRKRDEGWNSRLFISLDVRPEDGLCRLLVRDELSGGACGDLFKPLSMQLLTALAEEQLGARTSCCLDDGIVYELVFDPAKFDRPLAA